MDIDQTSASAAGLLKVSSLPHIDDSNTMNEKSPKERVISMLDVIENHVERIRKEASRLEEEKDGLLISLDTIRHTDNLQDIEEYEREDIIRYVDRITNRCHTVDVRVHIHRDQTQEEALFQVNHLIDGLVVGLRADPDSAKMRCLSFMNACASHFVDGVTDKNFESALLGCTLDDQKRVKKRLQGLLNYFDKLEHDMLQ